MIYVLRLVVLHVYITVKCYSVSNDQSVDAL